MNEPYGHIQVLGDPLAWARAHPSFFFSDAIPRVDQLVRYLLAGATALGSDDAEAKDFEDWSVVVSAKDWFAGAKFSIPEDFKFHSLTPFPELGDNCVRPEALIAAFAAAVVVQGPTGMHVVQGQASNAAALFQWLAASPQWRRAVAFRGLAPNPSVKGTGLRPAPYVER